MSTLDDKILGEKLHYYCSSSEEEDNNTDQNTEDITETNANLIREESHKHRQQWDGYSVNTGPKGVIKDWQRYKQFENEKRDQNQKEKLQLMKKLSITCRSPSQDSDSDSDDFNDDFLKEYTIKRMNEMLQQINTSAKDRPLFAKLIYLDSGSQFLEAIDKENKWVTIVCHIYTNGVHHCQHMNQCLSCLAQEYTQIKFCAIEASTAGMSKHFSKKGVPALLVYRAGNLLSNFVRLTDEFAEPFTVEDVEKFLIEHEVLDQSSAQNSNIRSCIKESDVECEDVSD